ncbi:serine/threonine-protein kinase SBK1-like [Ciona intestinalis]
MFQSKAHEYKGYEHLHPITELSRGRYGTGVLLVQDVKRCTHLAAKRVSMRDRETFERQITCHMRVSSHPAIVRFMGVLPSSTTCYQYAMEYVMEGNLRHLVVKDIGLPDEATKCIMRQLHQVISYLHDTTHIIHGDLRPENILMSCTSRCNIKLCNFSKAHSIGACVKMNSKPGSMNGSQHTSWRHHLRHFTSFLRKRRPSINLDRIDQEEDIGVCLSPNNSPVKRRPSSIRRNTCTPTEFHEYTVGDMKREFNSEIFSQAFTAPELVNATRYIASPASDNWSLAILAIYCVTGATPWEIASVDNVKYTNFLHSSQRAQSLTPSTVERNRPEICRILKIRSSSLTSLVGSLKRREGAMTPAFEKRVMETLQQPADKRVSIDDLSDIRLSYDSNKWKHYEDRYFNEEWRTPPSNTHRNLLRTKLH